MMSRKWQQDGSGRFVTMDRYGRLLTLDQKGQLVDYNQHVDGQKASERNQMAFTGLLFCSPIMLLGLGASFAIMDQFQNSSQTKVNEQLKQGLKGKPDHTARSAYANDVARKAMLLTYENKGLPVTPADATKLPTAANSGVRAENDKSKKKTTDSPLQNVGRPFQAAVPGHSMMKTTKLLKERRRIANLIELTRGKISLQESAKLHSKLEALDKALTRLSGLSM